MVDFQLNAHSVLQAGGKGSRQATSKNTPKALLRVGGTPMIERLLRQQVDCGIRSFTIITGWLGDVLEAHIGGLQELNSRADIQFVRESNPLGNVGSLAQIRTDSRPILFAFADLVTDLDFALLLKTHRERRASVTLTSHYETHRLSLGELQIEGDIVSGYREKPEKRFLICSGIAVFEPCVLHLIEPGKSLGLSSLVNLTLAHRYSVTHWTHGAFWMDINTAEQLERANALVKEQDN